MNQFQTQIANYGSAGTCYHPKSRSAGNLIEPKFKRFSVFGKTLQLFIQANMERGKKQ